MGGTKVALRLETNEGSHESSFDWPPETTPTEDLRRLAHNLPPGRVTSVGVAMPATLDTSGRVLTWPNRPSWTGLDLHTALAGMFDEGTEIHCADDGDLAALAEAHHAGRADLLYVGAGTGIGGGLVLDGRPCPGSRGSCELGHLIIDRTGPECTCGRHGCLQALASGPATLRRATQLRGAPVTFAALRDGLTDRQPWARAALEETCAALATGLVGITELTRPSLILIGGGFPSVTPDFVPTVSAHATRLARPGHPMPPIRPAALGTLSSLHGAVLAARGCSAEPNSR